MEINQPKKEYCEPMHTCEHILNQTMVRMFGCGRSINAHIEKKKSKCDYLLAQSPTDDQIHEP
jgi:Ser-tRNA(Ala) deacylase AlaX